MNKYLLFILIGIILYILNNKVNSFSIGIPEYNFISNDIANVNDSREFTNEPNNDVYTSDLLLDNEYYVWADNENDARRKLKRHIDLNTDDATLVDIRITTPVIDVDQNNKTNVVCKPNYNCNLVNEFLSEGDECSPYCHDDENCINYHTIDNCIQNCSFVNVNISRNPDGTFALDKTLEKDGFQILPELINVDSTTPIRFNQVYENHILFSEYIFMKFLERIYPGSNSHKIGNSLYYINGKIILSRYSQFIKRSTTNPVFSKDWELLSVEQQTAATTLGWNEDTWDLRNEVPRGTLYRDLFGREKAAVYTLGWNEINWYKLSPYSVFGNNAFPKLHMDFQKYITYESIDDNYGDKTKNRMVSCIRGQNSKFRMINNDYLNGIHFISNNKSNSINLWLLLYGSPNIKTMGFIDIIDDENPDKYDAETLRDMQSNDLAIQKDDSDEYSMVSFPGRLTPYFQINSIQYPNVLEIQTSDTTLDRSKPNINPNKLYTYDMIQGDVLAFRTDIPHIGFSDYDRTSIEFRYDYIEINLEPFDKLLTANECSAGNVSFNEELLEELLSEFLLNPDSARTTDRFNDIYQAKREIRYFMTTIFIYLKKNLIEKPKTELFDQSIFDRFLKFLDSVPTLNLDTNNNPNQQRSLDRLNQYIVEFINSL